MKPSLTLINPWIYDFAAYDLWSKPLGLLYLAGYLRDCGFNIHLIDCLDIHHPGMKAGASLTRPVRRSYGTGKFWKKKIPKPSSLKNIPRSYNRYGISRQLFIKELESVNKPAAILITSLMTYWYPGVVEAVSLVRHIFPDVPIILGGIYARLCRQHALQIAGVDFVAEEGYLHDPESLLKIMELFNIPVPGNSTTNDNLPYPAFDMLHGIDYICLLTSTGCPYRCRYCAGHFLNPEFARRDPQSVLEEIEYWHRNYGVRDFAFYDDALLAGSHHIMTELLEGLAELNRNLRFHTPNALHIREITPDIASLLYKSGFKTIRLGLETSDMKIHNDMDKKLSDGEFERTVRNLKKAGFNGKEIGAYILTGLPGQSVNSVKSTIKFAGTAGVMPYLAEYSPLPHTPLWEKAVSFSSYDILSEPLFHNNTLLPCWDEGRRERVPELKRLVRDFRQNIT